MIHQLNSKQSIEASIEEVWDFFSKPENLNELTPPSLHFKTLSGEKEKTYSGQIITYRIRILPFIHIHWVTEIKNVIPYSSFIDEQRMGPYKFWHHYHQFIVTDTGVDIIDTVHYKVGFSFIGEILRHLWIKHKLKKIFDYRKEKIVQLFPSKVPAAV